jgi:sulfofructose kinase
VALPKKDARHEKSEARRKRNPRATVIGVGINATDTIIRLPRFPTLDSKVEVLSAAMKPGGQVASAMVACRRWGLDARYVGKVGDDAPGKFQIAEMKREDVKCHWTIAKGCSSQLAYILVDEPSGERTVLWKRDPAIALRPADLKRSWLAGACVLLVDGHDTGAATKAARWAREEGITVVADLDNLYSGVEVLLEYVDFPITSKDFPQRITGEKDLLKSLPQIFSEFKSRMMIATLGRLGALAWDGERFSLCPGYRVNVVDTTGAGDIFHGAFVCAVADEWQLKQTLEFACAAAAINCTAAGARGRIGTLAEIMKLRLHGKRSERAYSEAALFQASRAAPGAGRQRRTSAHSRKIRVAS